MSKLKAVISNNIMGLEIGEIPNIMYGDSAYEVAVKDGFVGTEAEWVDSINATIEEVTVKTGAAGTQVKVVEGGTDRKKTLELTIPKGDKGIQGDKGNTGDKGVSLIVETGATPFTTQALMTASTLPNDSYVLVTDDATADKNGYYQKRAGTWVYLKWNPAAQAKSYTDNEITTTLSKMAAATTLYKEDAFTEPTSSSSYSRTKNIPTHGFSKIFTGIQTSVNIDPSVVGTRNDGTTVAISTFSPSEFYTNYATYDIPSDVVSLTVAATNSTFKSYREDLPNLFVLGNSSKYINEALKGEFAKTNYLGFPVKDYHPMLSRETEYDSTFRIPVVEGMVVKMNLNSVSSQGAYVKGEARVNESILANTKELEITENGFIMLATYNSSHANYDPTFVPSYELIYDAVSSELATVNNNTNRVASTYLPSLYLKGIRHQVFTDGTDRTAIQFLWYDNSFDFYVSETKRGEKKFIFKFDPTAMGGLGPHSFSMSFDNAGNVIALRRTENQNYNTWSDSVRISPYIFVKDNDYAMQRIDFSPLIAADPSKIAPCGWAMDCGWLILDDAIILTEYTRPAVKTANTWRITFPITDPNNWTRVQSFTIGQSVNSRVAMKHLHSADLDPYTGVIYTSSGDYDIGAAIYASTDNGYTFETILSGDESKSRVLGFTFMPDWIWWATDSHGDKHKLYRVARLPNGVMDVDNIETVLTFPSTSDATHATIYMKAINCLVFLTRADQSRASIPIEIYDLKTGVLKTIDTIYGIDGAVSQLGFRCECFEYVPRGNEIITGFSEQVGVSSYQNIMGLLGNTNDRNKRVNNLIVRIDRVGDEFFVSYDTVI